MTTRGELDRKFIAAVELLKVVGTRRVGELAGGLDITQPTVSDALVVLEHKGIVSRERDSNDGRATVVVLSKAGTAIARELSAEIGPLLDTTRTPRLEYGSCLRVTIATEDVDLARGLLLMSAARWSNWRGWFGAWR